MRLHEAWYISPQLYAWLCSHSDSELFSLKPLQWSLFFFTDFFAVGVAVLVFAVRLIVQDISAFSDISVTGLLCYRTSLLPNSSATGHLCYRKCLLQKISITGSVCYRASLLHNYSVTVHLCYKISLLQYISIIRHLWCFLSTWQRSTGNQSCYRTYLAQDIPIT